MMSALMAWIEWKEVCALGRCSDETRSNLGQFIEAGFHGFLKRFAFQTNVGAGDIHRLLPTNSWHLFETHLTVNQMREGKRYKDWLFHRATDEGEIDLRQLEGGAGLLLRDVVREYLKNECAPARVLSMDQPIPGFETFTLDDLLSASADPAQELFAREIERHAHERATITWPQLTDRERMAFVARELGVPFTADILGAVTGCGKTMIHDAYRQCIQTLCERLRSDYPDDDHDSIVYLAWATIEELRRLAVAWGKSENRCAPLFLYREGRGEPLRQTKT